LSAQQRQVSLSEHPLALAQAKMHAACDEEP
jgi:hypothetical protein